MVQPCQVKCSQPCQAKVRFGVGERSTNDDIRTDFFLFLFLFLSFFDLSVLYTIIHFSFFSFFGEFRPVIVNWWWWMGIFFSVHLHRVTPQRGDPTSGVYEQPTNTHFFALACGVVFDDGRIHIRPTRHKRIMERYPPFPRRDWFIYRHSSSSSSSYSSSSSSSYSLSSSS